MSNTSRDPSPASSSGFPPPGAVGSRLAIGSIMIDRVDCGPVDCYVLLIRMSASKQQVRSKQPQPAIKENK